MRTPNPDAFIGCTVRRCIEEKKGRGPSQSRKAQSGTNRSTLQRYIEFDTARATHPKSPRIDVKSYGRRVKPVY